MSMKFNTTLPSPTELKEEYPLSEKLAELKKKRDQEIRADVSALLFPKQSECKWSSGL